MAIKDRHPPANAIKAFRKTASKIRRRTADRPQTSPSTPPRPEASPKRPKPKPRPKDPDTISLNLRLTLPLHARLKKAAWLDRKSINTYITDRLENATQKTITFYAKTETEDTNI